MENSWVKKNRDITKFPASGLTWDINFEEGDNELVAIGFKKGADKVSDTLAVKYRYKKNGTAKALKLEYSKLDNGHLLVTATAIDKNGLRCLDYEERVYFQCLSGGHTLKNQGTPNGTSAIRMSNGKASIEVIPNTDKQDIVLTVLNQSFKGTYLKIVN